MQATKYTPSGNDDKEKLLDAMACLKDGNFNPIDESVFEDAQLAQGFNEMLEGIVDRNNRLVMRLNDAQIRITDNSSIKSLIEEVRGRKEPLERIKKLTEALRDSVAKTSEDKIEILSLTKQAYSTAGPALAEIEKVYDSLRNGDTKTALEDCYFADKLMKDVTWQLENIKRKAVVEYTEEDENGQVYDVLDADIEFLFGSFDRLLEDCIKNGQRLYRIGRDIDCARNDMFRQNSNVSLIDRMKIFSVDHLTVVWRLYNHTQEYEELKITQVNNSATCKFGLWCDSLDIPVLKESEEFKMAFDAHLELHEHAIACFVANEASDKDGAMNEFEIMIECWKKFDEALMNLAKFMADNGYAEETELWVFEQGK